MDTQTAALVALGIAALLVLAFFAVFRYRGKFSIKTKLGEVTAEGENAPPAVVQEKQPNIHEGSSQKLGFGSTGIGQIGTGSNVIVAQSGANVIVQTGERAASPKADEPQSIAETIPETVGATVEEAKPTSLPIRIPVEGGFDKECDTPPPTTTWVGRGEEILLMERTETKVIAITGIGGQGKSTLAAKYLVNTKIPTRIQDWRDCKEESNTLHTQLVRTIERITNGERRGTEISSESTASVIKLFLNIVASIDGVFVFDNIDQHVDVVHAQAVDAMHLLIEGALKSRGVARFIFTCRPRLNYEHPAFLQIELHGLSVEEARQLFRARGVNVEVKDIDELHELTQGHPLWLNLIATQVLTNQSNIHQFIARIKGGKDAGLPYVTLHEIWKTLKPKHQKLLRYLAETVRPETESNLEEFVSQELKHNQFAKSLRQLRSFDLVVVKSPVNGPDTIELHPLVREFVRRQFSVSERSQYITAIVVFLDRYIVKYRPVLAAEISYSVLQNWTAKTELLVNGGEYLQALAVLEEARGPLLRKGYAEEFVRLATALFGRLEWNEALITDSKTYDDVYKDFVDTLIQLGRFDDAELYIKKFEETVSGATARHVAVCDMRTYLYWTQGKHDLAKEWGKRGVEFKTKSHIDTRHDCSHNLVLARRDSGEIEEALGYFLHGLTLDTVLKPKEISSSRGGSYYGNVGRCLFFKGDLENAQLCLVKSAYSLERERHELTLLNQGHAGLWLGELLEKRQESRMAYVCYMRAANKWKLVSPHRAEKALAAAQLFSDKDKQLCDLKEWEIERIYTDWLDKVAVFTSVA
jgi:tetratricopeptide (TPR) repeat protein